MSLLSRIDKMILKENLSPKENKASVDLKSYARNATLAGSPAYQINFDYSYLDNNKKAIEIWTVKDNKVYIIDYVAYERIYDLTVPVVKNMIESFEITT